MTHEDRELIIRAALFALEEYSAYGARDLLINLVKNWNEYRWLPPISWRGITNNYCPFADAANWLGVGERMEYESSSVPALTLLFPRQANELEWIFKVLNPTCHPDFDHYLVRMFGYSPSNLAPDFYNEGSALFHSLEENDKTMMIDEIQAAFGIERSERS